MRQTFPEVERKKIVRLAEQTLWGDEGIDVLAYLRERRRLPDEAIKRLRFGYVPARIRRKLEDGNWGRHELAGRLVMPLFDPYGEPVAITSRDIREDADMKHWHESFEKRFHLYGLNVAKPNIIKAGKAIVVEGQFDVAFMHGMGFTFTVGILGSAMSMTQAVLLSRYCSEVFLLFDGDKGGREATARSLQLARERHFAVSEVEFFPVETPWGKDPDDLSLGEVVALCKQAKEKTRKARTRNNARVYAA